MTGTISADSSVNPLVSASWLYQTQVDTDVGKSQNQTLQLAMLAANFLAQGMAAKSSAGAGIDDDSGLKGGSEEDEDMPSITEDQHGVLQGMHDQGFDTNFPPSAGSPRMWDLPHRLLSLVLLRQRSLCNNTVPSLCLVALVLALKLNLEGCSLLASMPRAGTHPGQSFQFQERPLSQEHRLAASTFPEASTFLRCTQSASRVGAPANATVLEAHLAAHGLACISARIGRRGCAACS